MYTYIYIYTCAQHILALSSLSLSLAHPLYIYIYTCMCIYIYYIQHTGTITRPKVCKNSQNPEVAHLVSRESSLAMTLALPSF